MKIQTQRSPYTFRQLPDSDRFPVLIRQNESLPVRGFEIIKRHRQKTAQQQFLRFPAEPFIRIECIAGQHETSVPFGSVSCNVRQQKFLKQGVLIRGRVLCKSKKILLEKSFFHHTGAGTEIEQQLCPLFIDHAGEAVGGRWRSGNDIAEFGKNAVGCECIGGRETPEAGTAEFPVLRNSFSCDCGKEPGIRELRFFFRSDAETRQTAPADKTVQFDGIIRPCVEPFGERDFISRPCFADKSEFSFSVGRRNEKRTEDFGLEPGCRTRECCPGKVTEP